MKVQYSVGSKEERVDWRLTCDATLSDKFNAYVAETAAENYYWNHDGWDDDWPLNFYFWDENGNYLGQWSISMESVPRFSAYNEEYE